MIWLYIILGISVALNVGLAIALHNVRKKHAHTAQQLRLYNVCEGGMHVD